MGTHDIGLIGLGVMGQNLVLNMDRHGCAVAVFNRTSAVTEQFVAKHDQATSIQACLSLEALAAALKPPRRLMLMVKAGNPVDAVLQDLRPHLSPGDIIIDGGNSHFTDTTRRSAELESVGLHFLGVGVSGGEVGALRGPSLMPGGPPEAYAQVRPIFEAIAARAGDGLPCVAYLGPLGAGHYVKMVHNGIEYAVMQLIAEAYDLLTRGMGQTAGEAARLFADWNRSELASYLIEITAEVLARQDPETGQPLVDVILDAAAQKGTGRWTVQDALDLGVPVPTLSAAVEARGLSSFKSERQEASAALAGPNPAELRGGDLQPSSLRAGLFAGIACAYAQGMALLRQASRDHHFGLDLSEAARIWRAGCIIRADLLEDIRRAYTTEPDLKNLLLDRHFREQLAERQTGWRAALGSAARLGIPTPAGSASLAYYDGYRSQRLPANLIQAQRDFFGAHTYQRVDRDGAFHTEWSGAA
jgi:6-phosphogluconate dehydrogenase